MKSILILFHCESNTGYAIERLEEVFFRMALALVGEQARIHVGYPSMEKGRSRGIPADFEQYLIVDTASTDLISTERVCDYVRTHKIDTLFGFDQPVNRPLYSHLRNAGVRHFISYWGAPMSDVVGFAKLLLKRIEVSLHRSGPDHYIFESHGMARSAVQGRGIPRSKVHVVYLGVDARRFHPDSADTQYVYRTFGIEPQRRIFFYSGHMEPRKGVKTIMHAAQILARRQRRDWHILLLGNQPGEERWLLDELGEGTARSHVTFGGYRDDIERIHRGCHAGIIASTGWDSLTMSSLEMQASGLPLIVSNLPGLNEAVEDGYSGILFPPGDAFALADVMDVLLEDAQYGRTLSQNAVRRVREKFTTDIQYERLVGLVERLTRGS
jgi:glycosyltransferase involved in cell wall biosynthesis